MIYLDNATATPLDEKAYAEMLPFFKERFASPLACYPLGQSVATSLNGSFEAIGALIGAKENDSLLLSPSVEVAINAIFFGIWHDISREYGKNHYLSTQIEEAAQLFSLSRIEEMGGISTLLPVDEGGRLNPKTVIEGLSPRSALLSLSLANPVLGTVQPLEEIGQICQERGVLLHVDLTHAVGKIEFNLQEIKADIATFSCGSIFGPKNSAALWTRHGIKLTPLILGSEPETIGAIDPPLLIAFGTAAKQALLHKQERMLEAARFRSLFEETLQQKIPEARILFQNSGRLPCTSVILFPYVASETLLYAIATKGVMACMGGGTRQEIGHLLAACGIEPTLSKCGLSFTFSYRNSEEEIIKATSIIQEEFYKYTPLSQGLFEYGS